MGGAVGAVRLTSTAAGAVRGVVWGVAATVMMGLVSSSYHGPKVGEGYKLTWLTYGVPTGALIGALVGAVIARWMSCRSSNSGAASYPAGRLTLKPTTDAVELFGRMSIMNSANVDEFGTKMGELWKPFISSPRCFATNNRTTKWINRSRPR